MPIKGFPAFLLALFIGCSESDQPRASLRGGFVPERIANSPASADLMGVGALDVDSLGNIYVGDRSGQLLVFAPDGNVLRKLGRKGQGPGEFDRIQTVRVLPGDSVYAFDVGLQRATVFAANAARPAYSVNLGSNSMLFSYWTPAAPARPS